jgi:uncharacterized membrane protein YphA (DoxX/SURF4 family)
MRTDLEEHPVPFIRARHIPGRLAAGAFVLHTGLEKWKAGEEVAKGVHAGAAEAFPFLGSMEPGRFLKLLAAGEIAVGAALLVPIVPAAIAGAALTAFSGSLLTMYWRRPALHRPGSVWPTPAGMPISKDVWMLGIGIGLLADAATDRD